MTETRPAGRGIEVAISLFVAIGALIGLRALFRTVHDGSLLILFTPVVLFPYVLVVLMTRYFVRAGERRTLLVLAVALFLSATPLLSTSYHDMQGIVAILIPFGQGAVATIACVLFWLVRRSSG